MAVAGRRCTKPCKGHTSPGRHPPAASPPTDREQDQDETPFSGATVEWAGPSASLLLEGATRLQGQENTNPVPTSPHGEGRGGGAGALMRQREKILRESQLHAWEKPVFLPDLETLQICFCCRFKNILLPRSIILNPLRGQSCAGGAGRSRSRVSGCPGNRHDRSAPLWGCHYVGPRAGREMQNSAVSALLHKHAHSRHSSPAFQIDFGACCIKGRLVFLPLR